MREGGSLKFTFHLDHPDKIGDVACVRIHKANIVIYTDLFSHLRRELQVKRKIKPVRLGEFILVRFRGRQAKLYRERTQNMPGNAIVFAVRVSITDNQCFFQVVSLF